MHGFFFPLLVTRMLEVMQLRRENVAYDFLFFFFGVYSERTRENLQGGFLKYNAVE